MVEADSHLKLHPTSILDIYTVFEHFDMLSMGIQYQPYTIIPTFLGSDLGALGHLWSQNVQYVMVETDSLLKLLPASILDMYKVFEHIDMLSIGIALHSHAHTSWLSFLGSGSLAESKCCHYVMVEADSHLKLLPSYV
jgi:hypothetical protein